MEEAIGLKILTSKEFEAEIKSLASEKSISIIDSILLFCTKKGLEIETAASLISPKLKSEIETEAIAARMIISKKGRLPI